MIQNMFYDERNLLECFDYGSQESSSLVSPHPLVTGHYPDDFVEKIINEASSSITSPPSDSNDAVPQFYPQLSSQMYNVCPPNITITTREPIPPLPPPPLPHLPPADASLPQIEAQTPTQSNHSTLNTNVLNWMKGNETVLSTTLPTRVTSEVSSTSSIHADWNAKQDDRQTQKLKGRFC